MSNTVIHTQVGNPASSAAGGLRRTSRLHEDRGQQDLRGTFNPLNQLKFLEFGGKLDVLGNFSSTNLPCTVTVNGEPGTVFNTTNFLGGASVNKL